MPVIGVIQASVKLLKTSGAVYGGKTVKVRLEDSIILILLLLLKVSPPLFVIDVGKEMFALMGNVYDLGFAVSLAFIFNE